MSGKRYADLTVPRRNELGLLQVTDSGLYCPEADVYIDPWRPVDRAIITHGHSDHARWGSKRYLCHPLTAPILRLRLGADILVDTAEYGKETRVNGVSISLHPAGHILGSAQVRLAYQGEVWVVSGDYKLSDDGISAPYEPLKCQHFITESTFGLPIYRFPSPFTVYGEINTWWAQNAAVGLNTVILGYALGKSQAILKHLDGAIGPIFLHGAVDNVNQALAAEGLAFPGIRITTESDRKTVKGAAIVAPPSALGTPWLRKLAPYRVAMCSGWMQLRGARRRRGVDRGFVLSDHCDWAQLNAAVSQTGAENVYVTHGYESQYTRWLREEKGLNAQIMRTLFHDGEGDDL